MRRRVQLEPPSHGAQERLPLRGADDPPGNTLPAEAPASSNRGGGLANLTAALGGSQLGASIPKAAPTEEDAGGDCRVSRVAYDQTGCRYRTFRDAVNIVEEIKWHDWPVPGLILTVLWCLRFMLQKAGSPTLWHAMWRQLGRLNDNEPFVMLHASLCGILETGLCYDQLNAPALASFELICRQIQIAEEKYKEKFTNVGGDLGFDYHLMAGTSSRSQLCICPALTE